MRVYFHHPTWSSGPFFAAQSADGIVEVSHTHSPVVAHKPFHWAWANQLDKGNLERFRQRLHDICTHLGHAQQWEKDIKLFLGVLDNVLQKETDLQPLLQKMHGKTRGKATW